MIIVNLHGGLGNQLFQYAAGKCLAEKHKTPLYLETFLEKKYKAYRKYGLKFFNIKAMDLGFIKSYYVFKSFSDSHLKELFKSIGCAKGITRYTEQSFYKFDENLMLQNNNTYLEGFWQSVEYFKNMEGDIRSELTPRFAFSEYAKQLMVVTRNQQTVGIHIRRGDYVTVPKHKQQYPPCSFDYYTTAIDYVSKTIGEKNLLILLFSDDIEWVRNNWKFHYRTLFIDNKKTKGVHEDFFILQSCKNFVIANSTFSWWGAWLANNDNKLVVAPNVWATVNGVNYQIALNDWHKLPN